MKNRKLSTIVSLLVLVLQLGVEAATAIIILRLNMLPDAFTAVFLGLLAVPALITALLLFVKNRKGKVSIARRVIACILALLVICGCGLVAKLAGDAYDAFHAVTNTPVTTNVQSMYVLVRVDDPAKSLSDAKDYPYGIIADYDLLHTQGTVAYIEEAVGKSVSLTEYESVILLADGLLSDGVDAAIMNGVTVSLLLEQEGYEDFTEKVRILQEIPFTEVEPTTEPTEPTETQPPVEKTITNTPFVVYISGSDTTSSKLNISRSDVNILMVVNPVTKQVLLLNTPRDYYVPNPAGDGKLDKLTHCGLYGTDCSMSALSSLYDLTIDYYGQINFTGFETLVDAIGGITVYADESFKAMGFYIQEGENYLNGEQALKFARDRYHVTGGDRGRGKNQMKVIKAVIEKMTSGTTIISNYTQILKSLEGMFSTSLRMEDISMLVKMQLSDMASWNIQSFSVSGVGGSEKTYSMPGSNAYVMYPDEEQVAYASQLAQRVLNGEVLTAEDMKLPN